MFSIVGLGNPGGRYESTRHNVGFMLADRLADSCGIRFRAAGKSVYGEGMISGNTVVIVKPQTYMNRSGDALRELIARGIIEASGVIAAYDDCDLPLGRLRIRKNGGSGGHRGVASIIEALGTKEFPRIRLGIGRPAGDTADYVLSPFSPEEEAPVREMLAKAQEALAAIITEGLDAAMNRFNAG